jgi:PhnB protein
MQVSPYLIFKGQCEEPFKLYATCLGRKIEAMLSHEGTGHVSPEWRSMGDTILMSSHDPTDRYQEPLGLSVSLSVASPTEAERVFTN